MNLDLTTVFDPRLFLTTITTLVVIMDPLGNLPIYLGLTGKMSPADRRRAARLATLVAFAVISIFAVAGRWLLEALHITVPALQLSGGLLLLLVALELLMGRALGAAESAVEEVDKLPADASGRANLQVALVPLGTPLMAGPGAIVAVMLAIEGGPVPSTWLSVGAAVIVVHVIMWLSMHFGSELHRLLGESMIDLITRLSGMLLAAIATQLAVDAIVAFIDMYSAR